MGENSSKPIRSMQLDHLKLEYEPITKLENLPGQPLQLQLISPQSEITGHSGTSQRESMLQLYTIELNCSQTERMEQERIYEGRRNGWPWVVRVVCFDIQRRECECIASGYRFTVCTEHVESRLLNFKVARKVDIRKNQRDEILQSFTVDQGVYVLVNALHGYQMLAKEFRVGYPNVASIGITRRGQVKVWVCDNWAMNGEGVKGVGERQIIEEVVNLVAERTEGQLCSMLNLKVGEIKYGFEGIQDHLTQFIIHFNIGRKTLVERLEKTNFNISNIPLSNSKYSLGKSKQKSNTQQLPQQMQQLQPMLQIKSVNSLQAIVINPVQPMIPRSGSTERRYCSQETVQKKLERPIVHNQSYSVNRYPTPRSTTIYQSPTKNHIKFTYNPTQSTNFPTSKSSFPSTTYIPQAAVNQYNDVFRSYQPASVNNAGQQQKTSMPIFQNKNSKKVSFNNININQKEFMRKREDIINKKLWAGPRGNQQNSKNNEIKMRLDYYPSHYIQPQNILKMNQREFKLKPSPNNNPKMVYAGGHESPLARLQTLVSQEQSNHSQAKLQSLNQITEQFKNLLQSDKKTVKSHSDYQPQKSSSYQISQFSQRCDSYEQQIRGEHMFNQKSEQNLLIVPVATNFYSIKEVDQEVSYQIDSNRQ